MSQGQILRREKLENGIVLVINEDHSIGSVALAGSIKAGAMHDSEDSLGTAEFASRLITRGTKGLTAAKISQRIEEMGATLSFTNMDEYVSLNARCHPSVLSEVVEVISKCVSGPIFPEEEMEKARREILSGIREEADETRSTAYRQLMSLIHGEGKIYGRNPLGKKEHIERITRKEIVSFYEKYYSSAPVLVAACGDFAQEDLVSSFERSFSNWNGRDAQENPELHDDSSPQTKIVQMNHKSQADLALGSKAVPRKSEQYYALNLGNLIFGRMGLYGRLGKNVRDEKGLAYYCFSGLQSKLYSGHIGVYAGVNPSNIEKAIDGIFEEIEKMRNGNLEESELEVAKRNAVGSLSIALDTSSERVSYLHDIEYYGLGLDYFERYNEIIRQVKTSDVISAFRKYFDPSRMSLCAAGPLEGKNLRLPLENKDLQTAI